MSALCNYLENKLIDHVWRAAPYTAPSVLAHALILSTRGFSNNIRSSTVSLGDTVIPQTPNGNLYKCTTAGTTGATEPEWGTTSGGTTNDGTAVWTEQSLQIEAGIFTEVANSGGYARATLNPSLANWAGTQAAGSTSVSSGTGGTTSNNSTITFPAPSAAWGLVYGVIQIDSATYGAGNPMFWAALTTPRLISSGDPQPSFASSDLSLRIDN